MIPKHAPATALINGQMRSCIILQWRPASGSDPDEPKFVSALYMALPGHQVLDNVVLPLCVARTRTEFVEGLDDLISGHTPLSFSIFVKNHYSKTAPAIEELVGKGVAF